MHGGAAGLNQAQTQGVIQNGALYGETPRRREGDFLGDLTKGAGTVGVVIGSIHFATEGIHLGAGDRGVGAHEREETSATVQPYLRGTDGTKGLRWGRLKRRRGRWKRRRGNGARGAGCKFTKGSGHVGLGIGIYGSGKGSTEGLEVIRFEVRRGEEGSRLKTETLTAWSGLS